MRAGLGLTGMSAARLGPAAEYLREGGAFRAASGASSSAGPDSSALALPDFLNFDLHSGQSVQVGASAAVRPTQQDMSSMQGLAALSHPPVQTSSGAAALALGHGPAPEIPAPGTASLHMPGTPLPLGSPPPHPTGSPLAPKAASAQPQPPQTTWAGPALVSAKKALKAKVENLLRETDGKKGFVSKSQAFIAKMNGSGMRDMVTEENLSAIVE